MANSQRQYGHPGCWLLSRGLFGARCTGPPEFALMLSLSNAEAHSSACTASDGLGAHIGSERNWHVHSVKDTVQQQLPAPSFMG